MSLYPKALITFSMPGIWYTEDMRDGHIFNAVETGRRVHLLVAECAPNLYALVVSELLEGDLCAKPPLVIYRIMVPDVRVFFKTDEEFYTITVTDKRMWRFYLQFQVDHEFWEVAQLVAEAKVEEGIRSAEVADLVRGALDNIPTVKPSPPPPHIVVTLQESAGDVE